MELPSMYLDRTEKSNNVFIGAVDGVSMYAGDIDRLKTEIPGFSMDVSA